MKISTSFIVVQILVGVLSEAFASSASNQALGIGEEIESMVCLTIYFKRFKKKYLFGNYLTHLSYVNVNAIDFCSRPFSAGNFQRKA